MSGADVAVPVVCRFELHRDVDVSGVSGPGVVAEGVRLKGGLAIVHWLGVRQSVVIWPDFDDAVAVHGHGGSTRFVWGEPLTRAEGDRLWEAAMAALDAMSWWKPVGS